jgi:hypothetical protein
MTNSYKILVLKPEGKRPPGRLGRRGEDNIKVNLKQIRYENVDRMQSSDRLL